MPRYNPSRTGKPVDKNSRLSESDQESQVTGVKRAIESSEFHQSVLPNMEQHSSALADSSSPVTSSQAESTSTLAASLVALSSMSSSTLASRSIDSNHQPLTGQLSLANAANPMQAPIDPAQAAAPECFVSQRQTNMFQDYVDAIDQLSARISKVPGLARILTPVADAIIKDIQALERASSSGRLIYDTQYLNELLIEAFHTTDTSQLAGIITQFREAHVMKRQQFDFSVITVPAVATEDIIDVDDDSAENSKPSKTKVLSISHSSQ